MAAPSRYAGLSVKDEVRGRPCRDDGPVPCCCGATLPKKSGPFRELSKLRPPFGQAVELG